MLKKSYVRDGKHGIIGSVTSGFEGGFETVVRDAHEETVGRTSGKFQTTRNAQGELISINRADPGLLLKE
jgi:hypothetical protein